MQRCHCPTLRLRRTWHEASAYIENLRRDRKSERRRRQTLQEFKREAPWILLRIRLTLQHMMRSIVTVSAPNRPILIADTMCLTTSSLSSRSYHPHTHIQKHTQHLDERHHTDSLTVFTLSRAEHAATMKSTSLSHSLELTSLLPRFIACSTRCHVAVCRISVRTGPKHEQEPRK